MTIAIESSPSPVKSWSPAITATAAGISFPAHPVLFGHDRYDVPAMSIPCAYVDDANYKVALCRRRLGTSVVIVEIVLVEDGALPVGCEEIIAPIRWRLAAPGDTCASVAIDVVHRTLAPKPISFRVVDTEAHDEPVLDDAGEPVLVEGVAQFRHVEATYRDVVIEYVGDNGLDGLHRNAMGETVAVVDGALGTFAQLAAHFDVDVSEITSRLTPPPTVHAVSAKVALPAQTAERTRDRKVRKRVRELRQSARDMKQAGTTYAAMTAAQRQIIGELVALDPTGEVPMEIP